MHAPRRLRAREVSVAEALAGCGLDPFEARLLLVAASGWSRAALIAHPEAALSDAQAAAFSAAAARRRSGEPVAYILGEREFYSLMLRVSADVLIPRPETELLVELALDRLPPNGTLLDLGTGSGALALAVKSQCPTAWVLALERSAAALAVARSNAARLGLAVDFVQGDWFAPLGGRHFDVVAANPPYVGEDDPHLAHGDLRFEPRQALVSGADGLDAIRCIAAQVRHHLKPGGWLLLEHGMGQDAAVRGLLLRAGLENVASSADLAGIARVTYGQYNPY